MASLSWPKALTEACFHAHHPGLRSDTAESITMHFLWRWIGYPSEVWPTWEQVFIQGWNEDGRFAQDIFLCLQRAVTEGQEEDRVFALFLLGAYATPEARELLRSFFEYVSQRRDTQQWRSASQARKVLGQRTGVPHLLSR